MKKLLCSASLLVCGFGLVFHRLTVSAAPAAPSLTIQVLNSQTVQITWPGAGAGLVLEQTSRIGDAAAWQAVNVPPALQGGQFSLLLPISARSQFFRLRRPFTSIKETSPVDGETGVAVLRETIVHFTAPLSAGAVVRTNNFYA